MITYYSDLKDLKSINNPLINNGVGMRHSGFFEIERNDQIPYFGTSIKKTLHNQGRIFCNDSSKLFSISKGYVDLTLSFPYNINDGVLFNVKFSDKEYMLWSVNMGQLDIHSSGIGVFLTKNGIEFRVKTSGGSYSLIDNKTNISAESSFRIEFLWDKDGISQVEESPTMIIRVNDEDVIGGVIPIINDGSINSTFYSAISQGAPATSNVFSNKKFQLLDNDHKLNNLSCSISRLIISNTIPQYFIDSH